MSQVKQTSKRKHSSKALPVLGAAGLSFSLANGTSGAPAANMPTPNTEASLCNVHLTWRFGGARPTIVTDARAALAHELETSAIVKTTQISDRMLRRSYAKKYPRRLRGHNGNRRAGPGLAHISVREVSAHSPRGGAVPKDHFANPLG